MFDKKKFILVVATFFCISISLFFIIGKKTYSVNIETILKTSDYSYLSEAAKEYITYVYEETGEILLTEKNKEENVPYLNPEYIEYLNYINGDVADEFIEYNVIPTETIIDYVSSDINMFSEDENLPSKFDLRDVEGKNFVTPNRNQKSTGLCWAFATNSQAESHLLLKNDVSYDSDNTQLFSEMQLDYALAINGIADGKSLYSYGRGLGSGGTFKYVTDVAKDGLGFVDLSWRDFDTYDYVPMEKNKVYRYKNSKYDLLSTVDYPSLNLNSLDMSDEVNIEKRENYLNGLKKLIKVNGGAYVATVSPSTNCSINVDGKRLIYDDKKCTVSGRHAMHVIGWDDDFEYSFCSGAKRSNTSYYLGSASNCSEGTVISAKGAWILKNSWGSSNSYVYLAYDSIGSEFNTITGMDTRNWDNSYKLSQSTTTVNGNKLIKASYMKNNSVIEELSKIKFYSSKQNVIYNVCYVNESIGIRDCVDVNVLYPGMYDVDFSDKKYEVNSNSKFEFTSNDSMLLSYIYLYTSNKNDIYEIKTSNSEFEKKITNVDKYQFRISSKTINIPENSIIDYKILDKDRNEITVNYTYSENVVFANNVYSNLLINKELMKGKYILQTIYNDEVLCESSLLIEEDIVTVDGSGTEVDPYIINTPEQLNLMRLNNEVFYKLGQDIDLTYDTQNENGLFYNDGKGWEPIKYSTGSYITDKYFKHMFFAKGFSGGFDGDNHKITGLYINRPDEDGVGLFANTYNINSLNVHIKNVILEEPYIVGKDYVGGLIGYAFGFRYDRNLDISNISIIGGYIGGNNYVGGVIGHLDAGSNLRKTSTTYKHNISNLYNSAFIDSGNYGGGIFGMITNLSGYSDGQTLINIYNTLNKGPVMSYGYTGGIVGLIAPTSVSDIYIHNSINTGEVVGDIIASNIIGQISDKSDGKLYLNNIYYLTDEYRDFTNINVNNVSKMSISELKNESNYSKWNSFDTNWKIEIIDGITRLPILKNMDFEYLSIDKIDIELGKSVNISDYINPQIDAALNNDYEILDTSIANINQEGLISGLKVGNTLLNVISYYDGSNFDVDINVVDLVEKKTILFESNGGSKVESITLDIGSVVAEPEKPVRDKYNFIGWYLDNETFENKYEFSVMPEEDIILYAKWEKVKKTIFFESNGGTEVESITLDIGSVIAEPEKPVRDKYNFIGWYLDNETFENKYEFSVMPEEDITLYAKWEKVKKTIFFESNGGTEVESITLDIGSDVKEPGEPIRDGYNFAGWYLDNETFENKYEFSVMSDKNIILYAKWEVLSVKINNYDIKDNIILGIKVGTSLKEYLDNFEYDSKLKVEFYNSGGDLIENLNTFVDTNSKIKFYNGDKIIYEYINVVSGDVDGDGKLNLQDIMKLARYVYINKNDLVDVYLLASDYNCDNNYSLQDIMKMAYDLYID